MRGNTTARLGIAVVCLPPHHVIYDAIALTHLSELLRHRGYRVTLSYFNVRFHSVIVEQLGPHQAMPWPGIADDYELTQILPFLGLLAERAGDRATRGRLVGRLRALAPHKRPFIASYERLFDDLLARTRDEIDRELARIEIDRAALLGMSSKHMSWLPAMVFAERAKARNPRLHVVLGGWLNADSARHALEVCANFDYAIWGEGEQPLLELCAALERGPSDVSRVPHLFFRGAAGIAEARGGVAYRVHDMCRYRPPARAEFARLVGSRHLPRRHATWVIDGNRGCSWAKCTFCSDYCGYRYRERPAAGKAAEIAWLHRKYGARKFLFADNDMVGDRGGFDRLLEALARVQQARRTRFRISGEVAPTGLDAAAVARMARAGIDHVQIGYEATSDGILRSLGKRNRFADNLTFVKLCVRNRIHVVGANVLMDTPGATRKDILESIANLDYLRFFLGTPYLSQVRRPFALKKESIAYAAMRPRQRERFAHSRYHALLPSGFFRGLDPLDFISTTRTARESHRELWDQFETVAGFYRSHLHTYRATLEDDGALRYAEYVDGRRIVRTTFRDPVYAQVLRLAADRVCSLEGLQAGLALGAAPVTSRRLREVLRELKEERLLYASEDLSQVAAIAELPPAVASGAQRRTRHPPRARRDL